MTTINVQQWIDDNRHLLKPPVGNKCVFPNGDYIVMVVGGPNARKDYHLNKTPEFFYQLEGDIVLNIQENGVAKAIPIKQGEIFLLPARVPHSPKRGANTVGLVIESKRPKRMLDALQWYCEKCNHKLYEEAFLVANIETDMPKIFDRFYSDATKTTCKKCGCIMQKP
jgi:3-hydroxyanthranilate 3,4-dioxygenase